jgi:aryl-alcohol dehydrogenase-like predicted oxidoreductase
LPIPTACRSAARLGRTGLKVSRLCLGTMNFGPQTSEEDSYAIMDRALELGINFFDTANVYGWKKGEGVTEQIIGRWLAQGGGRREKVVLATKVYGAWATGPTRSGFRRYHIRRPAKTACAAADRPHRPVPDAPRRPRHPLGRDLAGDGTLCPAGQGHLRRQQQLRRLAHRPGQARRRARNFMGLVSEQSLYNLNARMIELEVIPACKHYGLGLIPWSPLAAAAGRRAGEGDQGRRASEAHAEEHGKAPPASSKPTKLLCRELGEQPGRRGPGLAAANPVVTAPIIGPRTIDQLDGSLRALEISSTTKP